MFEYDLQNDDFCHIQEIDTGKNFHQALSGALGCNLFTKIQKGYTLAQLGEALHLDETATELYLKILECLGLVVIKDNGVSNTPVAAKYLTNSASGGNPPLAAPATEFLGQKVAKYLPHQLQGSIFNASGLPGLDRVLAKDITGLIPGGKTFFKVILSKDFAPDLEYNLAEDGFLIILDNYRELNTAQSAVLAFRRYDTAGIKQTSAVEMAETLKKHNLVTTPMIPLTPTWGMVVASHNEETLNTLIYTKAQRAMDLISAMEGVSSLKLISVKDIVVADWAADHCRWGCSSYGTKCCPPNSPTYKETQTSLATYTQALLVEGEPPGSDFQKMMLKGEKIAFKTGFYKAFAYWAGPCELCTKCEPPEPPMKCTATRPSMESAGIDVFATVEKQGYTLRTLKDKGEFIKYFGLILLD